MSGEGHEEPVRVLYLAGSGRSGSTLVTTILGQFDGAFAAGELRYLWQRGLAERRPCGCGVPLVECAWWQKVLAELPEVDAADLARRLRTRLRIRRLPGLLYRRWRGRAPVAGHPDDARLAALYAALDRRIRAETDAGRAGPPVVVDSSKLPPYGALLAGLPGIDLRVLHVVRDPRATGFSWRRRRPLDPTGGGPDGAGDRLMSRPPLWKASLLWLVWNAVTVRLWDGTDRYLRIRYEDFVAAPNETIARVARFAGIDPAGDPFVGPGLVHLAPTHSVAGNPVRHRTGTVPVRPDDEWREGLGRWGYLLVTALTLPLLRGFGYPLRRDGARRRDSGQG